MPADPVAPSQGEDWRRISPLSVIDFVVVVVRQGIFQILPAFVVLFASVRSSDRFSLTWVLWGLSALLALGLVWAVLTYLRFGYRLRGERMNVRKGVLHRQTLNVEFDRIQNVSIQEPFYFRPFGLAALIIDTAGSSGKEIRLPGLALAEARRLRDRLVAEARATRDDPMDAAPEAAGEKQSGDTLVALSRRDVVIAGLTGNFMLWAAVALGAVFGSGDMAEGILGWLGETFRLREIADSLQARGGNLLLGFAAAGALFLALLLLPLISVIGALLRYDGYRLRTDGDRYRRSSGMLSRHDESVRRHKIQGVSWKQNAIARLFHRINLQLRQAGAGAGGDAGQQMGGGSVQSFLVPSLDPAQASMLTAHFLPGCDAHAAQFTRVNRLLYVAVNAAFVLVPMGVGMLTAAVLVDGRFALAWGVIALLIVAIAHRAWRQTGWAVAGDYAALRTGFIGSNTTWFPLFKIQRVDLVQTPGQRRRGLAHLTVHLASHSMTVPYMRLEDAERFRDLALFRAESTKDAWF